MVPSLPGIDVNNAAKEVELVDEGKVRL